MWQFSKEYHIRLLIEQVLLYWQKPIITLRQPFLIPSYIRNKATNKKYMQNPKMSYHSYTQF